MGKGRWSNVCSTLIRQFFLLLWKNFILQIRRPIGTAFEISIPILAVAVLVGLRLGFFKPQDNCFNTFDDTSLSAPYSFSDECIIYYAPNNTASNELMYNISVKLNRTVTGVPTQDDFIDLIHNSSNFYSDCSFGVYFDNLTADSADIKYSLRFSDMYYLWNTDSVSDQFNTGSGATFSNVYISSGFMYMEKAINEAIVQWKTGQPINVTVNMRQFPYPHYKSDGFLQAVPIILPLFMILAFLFSVGVFVKELVLEKATRMRETMKMMGLSNWILWSTWFLKQIIFYFGPILIITILLKYGRIFPKSDGFLLLIFLMLFMCSAISFCFFLSVWFSSPRIGLVAGFIVWFVVYFPYLIMGPLYPTLNLGTKIGTCILPGTCVGFGVHILSTVELRQQGLTFANFATPLSIVDGFNMGWVFLMLFLDTIFYMVLYWYIDAVKPGQYGVPKPLYFIFLPSYWCGWSRAKPLTEEEMLALSHSNDNPSAHEPEPTDVPVGINIERLTKVFDRRSFKKRKLAVDHLSLKMYKGQITALLGHNGAGKTTTMSILTGLFPPTQGRAFINGLDVVTDMDLIRYSLGICPQHNVLFDRLTVSEHLSFFARLKGCPNRKVKEEVRRMIEDLHLTDKSKVQSQKLSGGMKRKLSVGIALVGGSEVVILDEPTSGMDPYARRATWDLLVRHKEGRTILLTTHFMDEADLLGDRIAIMAEGKLRCSGSSLFLKGRYGVGYHLTIVKEPHCDVRNVASLVENKVTGSEMKTNIGAELSFTLPSQSSHLFPQLFDIFDDKKASLGISSYGISVTTMEEVFMRVSIGSDDSLVKSPSHYTTGDAPLEEDEHEKEGNKENETFLIDNDRRPSLEPEVHTVVTNKKRWSLSGGASRTSPLEPNSASNYDTIPSPPPTFLLNIGFVLWIQQFAAMFQKRLYHSIRFWLAVIWQLIIPLLFVTWALVVAKVVPRLATETSGSPSRLLSIDNSAPSRDVILFYASFDSANPIAFEDGRNVLGATNIKNFTGNVISKREEVNATTLISQCCNYADQILDKFCASRTKEELQEACGSSSSFGYSHCQDYCWSCCGAKSYGHYSCPTPPLVSINDFGNPSGPLDSMNAFIADQLLTESRQLETYNFFLSYQAGYVIHSSDPTYSVCGCQGNKNATCNYLAYALKSTPYTGDCETDITVQCDQLNITDWEYEFDSDREQCLESASCNYEHCLCPDTNTCQFGGTSQPMPPSDNTTVTVWYNNQAYHMAAAALNGFYNLYLKSNPSTNTVTISVTNDPLPNKPTNDNDNSVADYGFGFLISIMTIFGLSFLYASFIIFPIQEKQSKAKHLQFVSGVHASSYWMAGFAWDLVNAFIPSILIIILFAAFNVTGFKNENLAGIFLLVLLSCWACIPLNYVVSFLFNNALLGFCLMIAIYLFGSVVLETIVFVIPNQNTAKTLNYIFLIHPGYALVSGLNLMYNHQVAKQYCRDSCDGLIKNIFQFDYPGIGHIIVYMIVDGLIFCTLTILIERQFFIPKLKQILSPSGNDFLPLPTGEDEDVAEERRRINEMVLSTNRDAVVLKNLVKEYYDISAALCCRNSRKLAVNGVNLIIPSGECFGLLGVNGAGKTTTFKVLTGDIRPTSGTALLNGYNISTQLHLVQRGIGYCPQFDAHIDRLTGRELLTMFARLRGIPERGIKETVCAIIKQLDLSVHADKRCGSYSGGNKRKLSTAIALVGNPPILLLDEPTTGMDPATRRYLWNVLLDVIKEGRSVVLTSHSMEECEALCTRLAIMVNGTFKCLGSIQHLKSKFGQGYTLQIKISPHQDQAQQGTTPHYDPYDTGRVQHFVNTTFPGSLLLEQHQGSVTYQIPAEGTSWSLIFRTVEENKHNLSITDYSVCQTTLEQVFINFAQEQNVDE